MYADTDKLSNYVNELSLLQASYDQLSKLSKQLVFTNAHTTNEFYALKQSLQQLNIDLADTMQYFQRSMQSFLFLEESISTNANKLTSFASSIPASDSKLAPFFKTSVKTMDYQHRFHTTFSSGRSIMDYVKNGVCVGLFTGFKMVNGNLSKDMKYLRFDGDATIGKVSLSLDAKALLYDDSKLRPSLILSAEFAAALASASANINIGNSYIYAEGEANVGVGVAVAEAKAVINKDEISFKADASVAALRGEVKGSLSIFGIKITASASGDIGSIGAGVEYSSKKGEFEVGGHCSFLAGTGLKIKVNY